MLVLVLWQVVTTLPLHACIHHTSGFRIQGLVEVHHKLPVNGAGNALPCISAAHPGMLQAALP